MITARTFFNGKFLGQVAILYVCFFSKIAHSKLTVKTTIMTISIVAMIHVKFSMNFITMFLSCFPITIGTRIIIQGKKIPTIFQWWGFASRYTCKPYFARRYTRHNQRRGLIQYREQPFAIRYCVDIGWDFQHSHIPNSVKLIPCPLLFQLYRLC